ncbi:MAG: hypothetical protein AAF806_09050, partial [Bacteroidota bacterium]
AIGGILMFYKGVDFLEQDEDGNIQISKERQEKMERELEEYENAEQYALRTTRSGYFPCFSCKNASQIYLHRGEVWRYGVTKKGERGRYPKGMPFEGLTYEVQLLGNIHQCLVEEKRKIYQYAVLPENLKRDIPIIRPPGNKRDD